MGSVFLCCLVLIRLVLLYFALFCFVFVLSCLGRTSEMDDALRQRCHCGDGRSYDVDGLNETKATVVKRVRYTKQMKNKQTKKPS